MRPRDVRLLLPAHFRQSRAGAGQRNQEPGIFDMMTCEEAFLHMRADPQYAGIVRDAYVGADLFDAAARFAASAEFAEVVAVLGERGRGKVVDLGAGNGIASAALA